VRQAQAGAPPVGRLVEEAKRTEAGVDDRLGRLVGAAEHFESGLAEQRRGQL
jgi:hypothetical protein